MNTNITEKGILLRASGLLLIFAVLVLDIVMMPGLFSCMMYADGRTGTNSPDTSEKNKQNEMIGGISSENELHCGAMQPESFLDKLYFFGDSTTYGLMNYNVLNDGRHGQNYHTLKASQIWVPEGGTFYLGNILTARIALCDGRHLSLAEATANIRPEYLVITVGVNGLVSWQEENFKKYYCKMISLVCENSENTVIMLQSVYPVASNVTNNLKNFTNDKIDIINVWIKEIAEERGLTFINSNPSLKDENGYLKQEYQNGDGLHLNTEGFNAILEFIEKTVTGGEVK